MPSASPSRTPQPRRGRSSASTTPSMRSGADRSSAQATPSSTSARRGRSSSRGGGSGMNTPSRRDDDQQSASQRSSSSIIAPASESDDRNYSGPAVGDGFRFDLSSPLHYGSDANSPRSTTPHRQRTDLRMERSVVRQINIASPASTSDPGSARGTPASSARRGRRVASTTPGQRPTSAASEDDQEGMHLVIWGTNVVVNRTKRRFRAFLTNFRETFVDDDEQLGGLSSSDAFYLRKLEDISVTDKPFLMVNCSHVKSFDRDLYDELVSYPSEVIPVMDMAANDLFRDKHPNVQLPHQIFVKPFNAERTQNMRELGPEDIDRLITICGMVIRCSNPLPEMREAMFICAVCNNAVTGELDRGRLEEPTLCANCNTKHGFNLVHNRCHFTDRQIIKLQEAPEDMPAGQTPHTVQLHVCNELVDEVQPGDRVTVTGIYRAVPFRVNPVRTSLKSVFKTHIDVLHFRKVDSKRLRDDMLGGVYFTEDRKEFLKELSKKPDIYERLARAIAPSIYEHDDIKKGILLQLFGGTRKEFSEECGRGHFRSEINILLCGDPGTSKSQLLQYVFNLIPRSQYTSGKGSSAVGLTAYVLRDPETKQLVLQTGALVLADNGVCCIDEFDKMSDSTRSVLHEVMEQQTLSIAKAGLICQLNARTSILAAANPIDSQWNKTKTIVENIQLPHTLLSRFDLIFLMLDPQDELYDRRLAKHLVSLYHKRDKKKKSATTTGDGMEVENEDEDEDGEEDEEEDDGDQGLIDMTVLRDYIAYAREHHNPTLGEDAVGYLVDAYVEMRRAGSGRGQITAYPRQLESLMRLAEAHAKMRLADVVERGDVDEAWRLYREALKQSATDPSSGKIDVSILTTGLSSAARKRRAEVAQALRALVAKKGKDVTTLNLNKLFLEFREASELAITKEMFDDALRDLQDDAFLVVAGRTVRVNQGISALD